MMLKHGLIIKLNLYYFLIRNMQTANIIEYLENALDNIDEKLKQIKDYSDKAEQNANKAREYMEVVERFLESERNGKGRKALRKKFKKFLGRKRINE